MNGNSTQYKKLIQEARKAQKRAYAPYSNFKVGAAALGSNGKIYPGANVENASYGLSICAERNAIFQAALSGEREIRALAVVGPFNTLVPPCGACRQVLAEFGRKAVVVFPAGKGKYMTKTLSELLPLSFHLKKR